jgi:hypothetical protein
VAVIATFFRVTDDVTPVLGETEMFAGQVSTGFLLSRRSVNVQLGDADIIPVTESRTLDVTKTEATEVLTASIFGEKTRVMDEAHVVVPLGR